MKKVLTTLGILVLVGFLTAPVFAHRWGGGKNYGGPGGGPCWSEGGANSNLTESQGAELEKLEQSFFNDTAKLRDEIWSKSAELNTMLNSPDPNAKKAQALQKEISNLKAKMGEQRLNFELEARKIAPNARFSRGYARGSGSRGYGSRGYGSRGHGYGMGYHHGQDGNHGPRGGGYGPCWN